MQDSCGLAEEDELEQSDSPLGNMVLGSRESGLSSKMVPKGCKTDLELDQM